MDLNQLYQELIIDHASNPRNSGRIDDHDGKSEGFNPLCGDRVTIYVRLEDNKITDLKFDSCGCAISTASASIMSELILGTTIEQAKQLFHEFQLQVTSPLDAPTKDMGKLTALAGVKQFPARVKCATLAWHTLLAAIKTEVTDKA